ncbi:MAG: Hsp70 family protein [Verrucomicrobia bacterium]|nr:Hsp70 family protein [Verrucomicrobiota bacterium]
MPGPKFSIGIDLGTTNCALAFQALSGTKRSSEAFLISQWESITGFSEATTLPSFLYLPTDHEMAQMTRQGATAGEWVPGRFARRKAVESPGRVAHSAKSWLCHHAVDRTAAFLPWRSDEIPVEKRISPIRASALLLEYLRAVWDARFASQGIPFDEQEITVTVPASFDAAAQRLTLDAAAEAGFPESVRLLEEPQAAFYCWLGAANGHEERGTADGSAFASYGATGCEWTRIRQPADEFWGKFLENGSHHVLVIDIGGGTTDFSLFEISPPSAPPTQTALPQIKRIAVGDHLLLGGDNIDLALAHHIESKLATGELSPTQWNFLAARCRDLKEQCLSDPTGDSFPVSIPGRGSSLLGSTVGGQITRSEIESIVLDGFFPDCSSDAEPMRTQAGLREWALPYAADSAVTRYLAEFLRGQPPVEAVLFNGGSLYPEMLRRRLQQQIARWQVGVEPRILDNSTLDLAVALGAADFGSIIHRRAQRIEAGAARAIYLEVLRRGAEKSGAPALVCVLPRNAASEEEFRISESGLELRVNRPVKFQPYYSARRSHDKAGSVVAWNDRDFFKLPQLQATARVTGRAPKDNRVPVTLTARMNDLGLLRVACVSADPAIRESWPLEFNLRPHLVEDEDTESSFASLRRDRSQETATIDVGVDPAKLAAARDRITMLFSQPLNTRDKLTANNLLKSLEKILQLPKAEWNLLLIRALWPALNDSFSGRHESVEHEETWLILAGFLLRPGFGAEGDETRIDQVWRLQSESLAYPGKRTQIQQYILWRRIAGGLNQERQETILELSKLRSQKNLPPELVRLTGSLERIRSDTKAEVVELFLQRARELATSKQHCVPYLVALGLLLNRALFYAGPDYVVPPVYVERAFEEFSDFDWSASELAEMQTLFLRAGRVVDDPLIDLPKALRDRIASKLEKSGINPAKLGKLRTFVPVAVSERANLFGESLPPGLAFRE